MGGGHIVIVGAGGVIGSAAVEHFGRSSVWTVTALSRRAPIVSAEAHHAHIAVDLADPAACARAVATLPPVTHLVYAAVKEAPGLVSGWRDTELIAQNGQMFENILDPVAAGGSLHHAIVLQGTKAYGAHHHPVSVPAKEDRPRDDHPSFYWLHEDHGRLRAAEHGFALTLFRPQVLLGAAPRVAMNPALAIGAYAAICHERGLPFAYPGAPDSFWEMTDAPLLASAFRWAFENPSIAGQTFNITNGDVLVPAHAWDEVAVALGHARVAPQELRLAAFFAQPENAAAWIRLARANGLRIDSLPAFLGESHHYADLLLGARIAAKSVPVMLSTIKLRQAGFGGCRDSVDSLLSALEGMIALKLLPPSMRVRPHSPR